MRLAVDSVSGPMLVLLHVHVLLTLALLILQLVTLEHRHAL